MGTRPGVLLLPRGTDKRVFLVLISIVVAVHEFGEGFLAGNKIVRGRQAHADFQGPLAGNTVEVSFRENTQRLAEMGKQGIADFRRNRQPMAGFLVFPAGMQCVRKHGR